MLGTCFEFGDFAFGGSGEKRIKRRLVGSDPKRKPNGVRAARERVNDDLVEYALMVSLLTLQLHFRSAKAVP